MRIEQITDPQLLRQAALLLEAENRRLHERLAKLIHQLAALQGKSGAQQLQLQLCKLQEQMAVLQQRMFGRSSEKRPHPGEPQPPEAKPPQPGHGPKEQPALPIVEQHHELPEQDRTCLVCGEQMAPMGQQTEDSQQITVLQRQFMLVVHKRHKYRCCCNASVLTAPGPPKLIPGGRYSLEFALEIAIQKYDYHLPLERQVKIMRHQGLDTDSQTLWDQLYALSKLLEPVYWGIHAHLLRSEVIHADETRWMLLEKGGSKQWHAWALASGDAVFYHIDKNRSTQVLKQLLGDYQGVVLADGYVCYQTLARGSPKLVLAHCMAHARRKYVEALVAYPQCQTALDIIGKLYEVERGLPSLRSLVGQERAEALKLRQERRKKESEPLMEQLRSWALSQSALRGSLLDTAIGYMLSLWPGLTCFVNDPRVPIDNNLVERDLRGVAVGRKNHYGSKSLRGTQVAAMMYTLTETASRCGRAPSEYLLAAARHALRHPGSALLPFHQ